MGVLLAAAVGDLAKKVATNSPAPGLLTTREKGVKVAIWAMGGSLAAAALAIFVSRHITRIDSDSSSNHRSQGPAASHIATTPSPIKSSTASPNGPIPTGYKEAFAQSRNYWKFAHDALAAASAGDADAQFYLSRALDYCAEHNSLYFQRRGKSIGLDEALQYAALRHLPIDTTQDVYDRCHEFIDRDSSDLGRASDWLAQATAAGQPVAQAVTAIKLLMQESQRNSVRAGGLPNSDSAATVSDGFDPRQLLRAAVQSKDPEVLFSLGDALTLMAPTAVDSDTTRLAWWLVACQRGFDCSANAEWVKNSCANSPQCASADGPSDLVQTLAGDKWPEVEQRAREINSSLDQGKWDDLGLGS